MRGVFDERELEQAPASHDTELTLTPTLVLVLSMGLLLLCGVCYVAGYFMGHSGAQQPSPVLPIAADGSIPPQVDSGRPKPSANPQNSLPPSATTDDATPPTPAHETVEDAGVSAASGSSAATPAEASTQVRPALGNAAVVGAAPVQGAVGPAMPGPGSLMVQIAAVSGQDDANVLMGALRKRGYAVAARREPLDGLIHVRIGPFKSRDEAERWREKLLNDGYNAIVQD